MTPVQTAVDQQRRCREPDYWRGPGSAHRHRADARRQSLPCRFSRAWTTTPYIAIRQRRPDLVVLCFAPDDDEACQVLQMLQLDPATRRLPILTYVNGEAYAIIPSQWPRTSGIPSASNSLERLHGEVMVFQPTAVRQMSHGGMQVETAFPAAARFPARFPPDARRPLGGRQGPRRPFPHQRRRPGHHHLPHGRRVHRAVGARRRRHRRCSSTSSPRTASEVQQSSSEHLRR